MTAVEIPADAVRRRTGEGTPLVLVSIMTGEVVRYEQPVPSIGGFPFRVQRSLQGPREFSILWDDGMRVDGVTAPSYPWHRFTSAIEVFWVPEARLPELAGFIEQVRRNWR